MTDVEHTANPYFNQIEDDQIEDDEEFEELFDDIAGFNEEKPPACNVCPKCILRLNIDEHGQYVCSKCSYTTQIYGDLEVDGNHDNRVNIRYSSNGTYIGGWIGGLDQKHDKDCEKEIRDNFFSINNKSNIKFLPVVLCEAATRISEARQFAPLRCEKKLAMEEIFIKEALKKHNISVEPDMVAEFLGIQRPKRAFARAIVNRLAAEKKIGPVDNIHNNAEDFTNTYLQKLEIDTKYGSFVNELINRASTALLQASATKSKCIGSIWILILAKGINISANKLAEDLKIKQNTFISFAVNVMNNLVKFQPIFEKHEINHRIDMNRIMAKKGSNRGPRSKKT